MTDQKPREGFGAPNGRCAEARGSISKDVRNG